MRRELKPNPYSAPQYPGRRGEESPPIPVAKVTESLYMRLSEKGKITISPGELKTDSILIEEQEIGVGNIEVPDMVLQIAKIAKLSADAITIELLHKLTTEEFAPNLNQ